MSEREAPTVWVDTVTPGGVLGGVVCAVEMPDLPDGICGIPVESEPCPEHPPAPMDATHQAWIAEEAERRARDE